MISPVLPLGLGGGGCLLGSVGLSDGLGLVTLLAGGGVIGLGMRLTGCEGEGGRGRVMALAAGVITFIGLRGLGGEKDLDLRRCIKYMFTIE